MHLDGYLKICISSKKETPTCIWTPFSWCSAGLCLQTRKGFAGRGDLLEKDRENVVLDNFVLDIHFHRNRERKKVEGRKMRASMCLALLGHFSGRLSQGPVFLCSSWTLQD